MVNKLSGFTMIIQPNVVKSIILQAEYNDIKIIIYLLADIYHRFYYIEKITCQLVLHNSQITILLARSIENTYL